MVKAPPFGPQVGVDEDPVTGSAHCVLTPYWAERLGKTTMVGYQASARGGVVTVTLAGDGPEIMVESASGDITLESGTWWGGKSDDETGG